MNTEQDKAVALAERIKTCVHHGLPEQWVLNLLADHRQQVIEELAVKSAVMPREDSCGWCEPDEVREAIATMQAKVEQAKELADSEGTRAVKYMRRARKAEARVDELLNHCPDAECGTCASIICPDKDPLHFHHDGCPACAMKGQQP